MTGKKYKRGNQFYTRKGGLSVMVDVGNSYHASATETLVGLYQADSRGWIKSKIKHYEKSVAYVKEEKQVYSTADKYN